MRSDTCEIFLNGFCLKKQLCEKSHDVKTCSLGPNCSNSNCEQRHPPFCKNFVKGKCGFHLNGQFIMFSKCAFFHPPKVSIKPIFSPLLPPYHPLHPHPKILPIPPDPTLDCRRIQNLESQVHKLSREVLAMNNKLATGVYGSTNKTELVEEPDLEIFPTNQQDEDNVENCLKVTNENNHWWPWSKQKQSSKPSEKGKPTIHSLPHDDCEVINILGQIENKIATFKPKLSSLESLFSAYHWML